MHPEYVGQIIQTIAGFLTLPDTGYRRVQGLRFRVGAELARIGAGLNVWLKQSLPAFVYYLEPNENM